MNIRKTTSFLLLCIILCLSALAFGAEERIFDRADLLTPAEEQRIAQAIADFQTETGMDFVVLTTSDAHAGKTLEAVADDFYDHGGFGFEADKRGALFFIDMYERYPYISTRGEMIDHMTDERIDSAMDRIAAALRSDDFAGATEGMLNAVLSYVRAGIPEGQYQYDIITGERLTARHKALTINELLISAAIALVIAVISVKAVSSQYQLKGSTYRYQYRNNAELTMTDTDDTFQRTFTTRTAKPSPPSGGAGGGTGGGSRSGGSGVHTSSSGSSHGGGRGGRF